MRSLFFVVIIAHLLPLTNYLVNGQYAIVQPIASSFASLKLALVIQLLKTTRVSTFTCWTPSTFVVSILIMLCFRNKEIITKQSYVCI